MLEIYRHLFFQSWLDFDDESKAGKGKKENVLSCVGT